MEYRCVYSLMGQASGHNLIKILMILEHSARLMENALIPYYLEIDIYIYNQSVVCTSNYPTQNLEKELRTKAKI